MYSFPLSLLLDSTTMEKLPVRCATSFYHLYHTGEQAPQKDCLVQIPKTEQFTKVGTVLVFARKLVAPNNESPDPDDSPQEYLLSDDNKTFWGQYWQLQEKDRWSLIPTGIVNKTGRVVFRTRAFTTFIVVQLSSGDERSEREEDDASSSEEEEDLAAAGEEEDGEKEDKGPSDPGEERGSQEAQEAGTRRSRKLKKRRRSVSSSLYGYEDDMCLQDEAESELEEEIVNEQAEGEGEEEGEDKPAEDSAETAGDGGPDGAEDTGEPDAPAPSPLVNKEENNKEENASNNAR
ncbi:hypothetical protein ElyMa_000384700 [Elysia marginata]|uniref:Uncharacterized protein n=1 Tax=Elysia marginata TaxID=1093978 RepID=A0AAV4FK31_9GAST|nr:hypothetical protein ElyMa_000384700 [Elysia marginata]